DPEWSTLGISGLFVDMLRRIVALSQGVTGNSDKPLPPVETLDGYGRLQRASATASTIQAGGFAKTIASAKFPPGFYGTVDARRCLRRRRAASHRARPAGAGAEQRRFRDQGDQRLSSRLCPNRRARDRCGIASRARGPVAGPETANGGRSRRADGGRCRT